jgi:hypothetical protein
MNSANYKIWEIYSSFISQKKPSKLLQPNKIIPGILRGKDSPKHISADEIKDYMLNAKKSIRKMLCIGNKSSIDHHQAAT